jgi:hypothetical protein
MVWWRGVLQVAKLRWLYRYEAEHLLVRSGFASKLCTAVLTAAI